MNQGAKMPETALQIQTIEVDGHQKYTISYPLTDENGQPLLDRNQKPKFTNLIADTVEELVLKQAHNNIEVSRALERSSRRFDKLNLKPTPAVPARKIEGKPLTADETLQVGLDAQDPRKAADAIKRVVESVVPTKEIVERVETQGRTLDVETRKRIAREFIASNKDYLPIEANNALLNRYLIEQNLEFSVANLEFAAAAMAEKLVAPKAPHNDPPPSPDNAAIENETPNPGSSAAPQRRAPSSGIRNSQVTDRPAGVALPYTREQLLKMAVANDPEYDRLIRDPASYAMVNKILSRR